MRTPPRTGGGAAEKDNELDSAFSTASAPFRQISDCPPNWRAVGHVIAANVAAMRRQRLAVHLHSLGPRAVLEAMLEVAAGADLDVVLADFGTITPEVLKLSGGDKFPAPMLARVSP